MILPDLRSASARQTRNASRAPSVFPSLLTPVKVPTSTMGDLATAAVENGCTANRGYFALTSSTKRASMERVATDCAPDTPSINGSITRV